MIEDTVTVLGKDFLLVRPHESTLWQIKEGKEILPDRFTTKGKAVRFIEKVLTKPKKKGK